MHSLMDLRVLDLPMKYLYFTQSCLGKLYNVWVLYAYIAHG